MGNLFNIAAAGTLLLTFSADIVWAQSASTGSNNTNTDIAISNTAKPNFLFIISDDQGLDASAQYSMSEDVPHTPVLNTLAMKGLVFENVWATPSCTTTRGSIISGLHGVNSGVSSTPTLMNSNILTAQRFLASSTTDASYASAVIGKWHLAGGRKANQPLHPNESGVDYYAGNISGTISSYFDWPLTINGTTSNSKTYHTTKVTNLAIDWINDQKKPWFMWLAYVSPHAPFHLPPENLHTQKLSGSARDIKTNPRPYYLAAIEAMDTEIGRLLDSLPTTERDSTMIVFLGDNGTPGRVVDKSVYGRRKAKGSLYEGGIRVPMILSGHGVTRLNQREPALVNTVDLFATVSEAAGLGSPPDTDGLSFLPLLSDSGAKTREFNYSEYEGRRTNGWTVRNADYKYIEFADGTQELYQLRDDPKENNNLINETGKHAGVLESLRAHGLAIRTGNSNAGDSAAAIDITDATLVNPDVNCESYANNYRSEVTDINNQDNFIGELSITVENDQCVLKTNSIPNHDFNDGSRPFRNEVAPRNHEYRIPRVPKPAASTTALSLTVDNAILLNGAKVDILAAGCFGVGDGRIGCNNPNESWRYDPMHSGSGFHVDSHNAHTQPNGAYHYHGEPMALFSRDGTAPSPVVGFAADGFPIFGSFIREGENVRKVQSSYRLKTGNRPSANGAPGGTYDGTFRDDYEYVSGLGDLDECNGMVVGGSYRYHITKEYPYVVACFKGTPDDSFSKRR